MAGATLKVERLSKSFGALKAVDNVSFAVERGELLGIAGPNGSGKSTLFNAITRVPFRYSEGAVWLDDQPLHRLANDAIAKHGIARTFQRESVFSELSAIDNVLVTVEQVRRGLSHSVQIELAEQALERVQFPATLHNWKASLLPVYLRKLVMIASALALEPKVLLLDEPASSLTVDELARMRQLIVDLKSSGLTILLVEHVLQLLMAVSDRLLVLDQGRVIAIGSPDEVVRDPQVVEAYLGTAA